MVDYAALIHPTARRSALKYGPRLFLACASGVRIAACFLESASQSNPFRDSPDEADGSDFLGPPEGSTHSACPGKVVTGFPMRTCADARIARMSCGSPRLAASRPSAAAVPARFCRFCRRNAREISETFTSVAVQKSASFLPRVRDADF